RGLGESFEHQRLPCFLCTACLVTPSSSAISCQDQPCTLALRTWTASRRSSSLRNAATARSPTRGSSLPAAVAKSVASVMVSTYVDSTTMSTSVDTCDRAEARWGRCTGDADFVEQFVQPPVDGRAQLRHLRLLLGHRAARPRGPHRVRAWRVARRQVEV